MNVVRWIDYSDAPTADESLCLGWLGGWFNAADEQGQRWQDYLDAFDSTVHPYLEAVRADVVQQHRRVTGEAHQHQPAGVPVFTDGTCFCLSYRAWGDLMAAIWSEHDKKDYGYMNFYM